MQTNPSYREWLKTYMPKGYYRQKIKQERECAVTVFWCIVIGVLLLVGGCTEAFSEENWTNEEIVQAIYQAEGGEKAKYPYGIRSVKCEGKDGCRTICENTVRNNKKRFRLNPSGYATFLEYLAGRYAPVGASNDPKNLNKNWLKNVRYFLNKNRNKGAS